MPAEPITDGVGRAVDLSVIPAQGDTLAPLHGSDRTGALVPLRLCRHRTLILTRGRAAVGAAAARAAGVVLPKAVAGARQTLPVLARAEVLRGGGG